jgi:hypothetical protein
VTDILTNDEISLLRSLEKKSRTITGNFTHKRYDRLETKGYIKRSSQPPSMQDNPVRDNRRRKSCAEGCWWRCRMKLERKPSCRCQGQKEMGITAHDSGRSALEQNLHSGVASDRQFPDG